MVWDRLDVAIKRVKSMRSKRGRHNPFVVRLERQNGQYQCINSFKHTINEIKEQRVPCGLSCKRRGGEGRDESSKCQNQ